MGILLAFAPFIGFALVDRLFGAFPGLLAGAAISLILLGRDKLAGRSPKILETGSLVLFAGLAIYVKLAGAGLSIMGVRLLVDSALLLIVLLSLAVRAPFTLQYAREGTSPDVWSQPRFMQVNVVITAVWAAAFGVIVLADLVLLYMPQIPAHFGTAAIIISLIAAFKFTRWYPERERRPPVA